MKINDVTHAIMFGDFTNDQLNAITQAVKYRRGRITQEVKSGLSVGDLVKFPGRNGQYVVGIVKKVNRKFVLVTEKSSSNSFSNSYFGTTWRVPANMLEEAQ